MSNLRTRASKATSRGHRAVDGASDVAQGVATSPWLARLARVGLASRATIYVLMAVLALQVAFGKGHKEVDQNGALRYVAKQSYGPVLLWILALGFLSYAVWRATEAIYGEVGGDRKAKTRITCAVRALIYLALAVTTVAVVTGRNAKGGSASQNRAFSASLMKSTGGRVVVGVLGLVVAVVGLGMIVEGWRRKFERYLRMQQMSGGTRKLVSNLGRFGTIARGVVFVVVGLLTLRAAWQHKPKDTGGIDEAIKTLANTPGGWLLVVVALGLLAFGIYGFAEARWRRTERSAA
ncbi:MAG: hypothetical protein QOF57_305 [Frankiaceae bacterium]|nr:hypothetical protein [Frankiaceae bacterium]